MTQHTPGELSVLAETDGEFVTVELLAESEGTIATVNDPSLVDDDVALANAHRLALCWNSHDTLTAQHTAMLEALVLATQELATIRTRDGAPQHIEWDRGVAMQVDGCSKEYWNELTDQCFAAIKAAQ